MNCAEQAKNPARLHLAVVAVNGSFTTAVYAAQELMQSCRFILASLGNSDGSELVCEILSAEGDSFLDSNGRCMPADGGLKELPDNAVITFPGFGMVPEQTLPALLQQYRPLEQWLREHHGRGCTLAAGCNGNFLLTEAGLMQGRPVTTSWLYAEAYRRRYPDMELDMNSILLDFNRVISVGGILCGLDLMLYIIEQRIGLEVARHCAKFMLLENRQPSKVPFEMRQSLLTRDPMIKRAIDWIRQNLAERISVDDILAQVPVSKRNFSRRFREETGESPAGFVQRMRIERAKSLLETSDLPVDRILEKIGYTDNSSFSRQFRNHTMMTPKEYRERFRVAVAKQALQ